MSTYFATYSLRWFKSEHSDFLSHGWLAVVASGSRFYFTPSVPRFNLTGYDS
ncbi:hypothetical protein AAEJ74_25585 [Limnospira fusiformis PMC 851.14]|uniref:Uncharacterized protein n=1 Tax=Limnospira fusiformis PMC 851.14 TaxID=2219512 RepID=A0ABU9ESM1_LIMFS